MKEALGHMGGVPCCWIHEMIRRRSLASTWLDSAAQFECIIIRRRSLGQLCTPSSITAPYHRIWTGLRIRIGFWTRILDKDQGLCYFFIFFCYILHVYCIYDIVYYFIIFCSTSFTGAPGRTS